MIQTIKIGNFYNQSSYNTMFYIGCVFFILLLCWKKHREVFGISLWKAAVMALISIGFGYGTTSLMFGFENHMQNFTGFSWYGAVFFMPLAILLIFWFVKYILKLNTLDYIHNLAAPLALMNGFMKVGCTLYGCCYGPVTTSHFHIYNEMFNRNMFPIQPIEAFWNFVVCAFILWYERQPGKLRLTYPVYMITYSVGRFFCEFGRQSSVRVSGFLTGGMVYALVAIAIGIVWVIIEKNYEKKEALRHSHPIGGVSGWRQHV